MQLVMQDGRSFALSPGVNTIGRSRDNTVSIDNLALSRKHAQLRWDPSGAIYLMDVGSVNGTWINEQRLPIGQWYPVPVDAQIRLGTEVICRIAPTRIAPREGLPADPFSFQPDQARLRAAANADYSTPASARLAIFMQAIDSALDRNKLIVAAGGILLSGVLGFLGLLIASSLFADSLVLAVAFILASAAVMWIFVSLTTGSITKMSYAHLTDQPPVTIREALNFAWRRLPELALTPIACLVVVAVIGLAETIVMLVGRIDYIGEIVISLLFLPALALNLFLIVLVGFGSALIAPTIVDRGRGVTGTLQCVFELIRRIPGQVALYLSLSGLLTGLVTWIIWGIVVLALAVTMQMLLAGAGLNKLSSLTLNWVPNPLRWGGPSLRPSALSAHRFTYSIAGFVMQLGILGTVALALAFPFVLQVSLACAVYLRVKNEVPE
jgi:hypothetical protein